jgi:hypothetical protein
MPCKHVRRDDSDDIDAISISRSVRLGYVDDKNLDMDGKEAQINSRRRRCRLDGSGPLRNVSGISGWYPTVKRRIRLSSMGKE